MEATFGWSLAGIEVRVDKGEVDEATSARRVIGSDKREIVYLPRLGHAI